MYGDPLLWALIGADGRQKKSAKTTKKKKKHDNWFESCNATQLKELCRASKLPVSGTKPQLIDRLLMHDTAGKYGNERATYLKHECKGKLLVQSGNKYDLLLRLLRNEFGTGDAKRAATETVVDESSGREVQVLKKKRKTTPTPGTIYTRVEKKIKAVSQKKYQSHYGSKSHSSDVYGLMKGLIKEHCIEEGKIVESEPLLAMEMAKAVFQAFYDHWQNMVRTGYDTEDFREAVDLFADVLKAARPLMSPEQVEEVVNLMESTEACVSGYGLHIRRESARPGKYSTIRKEGENVIRETILVVMPDYDEENREKKKGKPLDYEMRILANSVVSKSFLKKLVGP